MEPDEWRRLVGVHVERQRAALFSSRRKAADGSGVSEVVWRQVETGKRQLAPGVIVAPNPEPRTKEAVTARIGWTADSIDRLLRGEDPISLETTPATPRRERLEDRVDRIEAAQEQIAAELAAVAEGVEAVKSRLDQVLARLPQGQR